LRERKRKERKGKEYGNSSLIFLPLTSLLEKVQTEGGVTIHERMRNFTFSRLHYSERASIGDLSSSFDG